MEYKGIEYTKDFSMVVLDILLKIKFGNVVTEEPLLERIDFLLDILL